MMLVVLTALLVAALLIVLQSLVKTILFSIFYLEIEAIPLDFELCERLNDYYGLLKKEEHKFFIS